VLRGIEGEQTLAAATANRSLNLLHTSYAPLPALLKNIEERTSKKEHRRSSSQSLLNTRKV
jgi:hypothetical protein